MTNHSRLSPSSRHRWQLCPGSVREEAKYPDTPSKASIDGTHSHTLLEMCLTHVKDACKYVGNEYEDHDGTFIVDAARAERVQVALDYIRDVVCSRETQGDVRVITEKRVHPDKTTGRNDLSGTVDVQIHGQFFGGQIIQIIDYKDGMSPVEAKGNPQLEQYALGVIDDNNLPQDCVIRMTIIQPKLAIKGLPVITSHDMTVKELREVVAPKLVLEAAATDDPNAPLVPGDVQCKHCKAKGGCTALVNKTMESVGMMFKATSFESVGVPDEVYATGAKNLSDSIDNQIIESMGMMFKPINDTTTADDGSIGWAQIDNTVAQQSCSDERPCMPCFTDVGGCVAPTVAQQSGPQRMTVQEWIEKDGEMQRRQQLAQQSANKDPTTMTNEQLVEILEAAPLMRQMLDAAEEEALNRAKAGQTIPGYKIVHGPGSRAWEYSEEEMAAKLVKMGIPKKSVYVTKLVSPAQAEKLMWEKKGVKTTLSKQQLERMETEPKKTSTLTTRLVWDNFR